MNREPVTAERLRELLSYDPETGAFVWRVSVGPTKPGKAAGYVRRDGYASIRVDGRLYLSHRLAWLYVYGDWPDLELDHINGNKADNRISNLRDVSHSENLCNQHRARSDSSSGILGVFWIRRVSKWRAHKHGRHIGYFSTADDAKAAWDAA